MSSNGQLVLQLESVKNVHFASGVFGRICKVAGVAAWCKGDQSIRIGRYVLDSVDHVQIGNVVNKDTVLQTHHQTLAVKPHRQDGVQVRILNDFRVLLKMAHFKLPWRRQADNCQETGGKESLDDASVT